MSGMGVAMMGTAAAEGPTRAIDAAKRAISSPLLEDTSVNGARGVIINVTGGPDMSLIEVNEALTIIQESAHEDAEIIFGAVVDDTLSGHVKITVIATGFDHVKADRVTSASQTPVDMQAYAAQLRPASDAPAVQPRMAMGRRATDALINGPSPMVASHQVADGVDLGMAQSRGEFDPNLELEVPAFLRRSEG
jgi:cell division protein FtsZ